MIISERKMLKTFSTSLSSLWCYISHQGRQRGNEENILKIIDPYTPSEFERRWD